MIIAPPGLTLSQHFHLLSCIACYSGTQQLWAFPPRAMSDSVSPPGLAQPDVLRLLGGGCPGKLAGVVGEMAQPLPPLLPLLPHFAAQSLFPILGLS